MLCIRGRISYWLCACQPPPPPPPPPQYSHDCETLMRQSCNSLQNELHKHCTGIGVSRQEFPTPQNPHHPHLTHPHPHTSLMDQVGRHPFFFFSMWCAVSIVITLAHDMAYAMHVACACYACGMLATYQVIKHSRSFDIHSLEYNQDDAIFYPARACAARGYVFQLPYTKIHLAIAPPPPLKKPYDAVNS